MSTVRIDDENLPEVESFGHIIEDLREAFQRPAPRLSPPPLELALARLALTEESRHDDTQDERQLE